MDIYLTYTERSRGGETCKGQENDPWPSHEDEYIDFTIRGCFASNPKEEWMKEVVHIDFDVQVDDDLWIVVARYTSGGTFGRTHGRWYIAGVYKKKSEARNMEKKIRTSAGDGGRGSLGFMPWHDYFGGLNDVELVKMTVEE